jgi:quaternary ammonium compound-resistance protein SugE
MLVHHSSFEPDMHWMILAVAGVFEVGFTYCLKRSDSFRYPVWTTGFVACAIASLGLLNVAAREIPLGTAYAVWTGIGAAGTAGLGILCFREPATALRIGLIALLIAAVVGLKFVS